MIFPTEQFRNGDKKTTFKVVDFDEHNVEAALCALEELIEAREYLNTNNPEPNITVALIYVTANRLVKGKHARTWAQKNTSSSTGCTHNSTLAQRGDAKDR